MIWSLQTLRFIAAMLVVYMHASNMAQLATGSHGLIPARITSLGSVGVDLFFILSGVVMARTAPKLSAGEFVWRRIRRIVPIYLFCSIPAYLVAAPYGITWRDLLASLLLWPATDVMTQPLLPVAWTLCYEMLFYMAVAIALIDRRLVYVLLACYAAAMALRPLGPVFQFVGNPLVIEFLFGVLIARIPLVWFGTALIPIAVAAIFMSAFVTDKPSFEPVDYLIGDRNWQRLIAFGIPSALIVYGTMHIKAKPSVWTYLGEASYSIYLVHITVVTGLGMLWQSISVPHPVIVIVGITASLLLAWRVHELIELPMLRALPPRLSPS